MPSTVNSPKVSEPSRVLVLGGGDIGSAVAHRLFRAGIHAVICERARSSHARRGMAYTDVLFDGQATLEGVPARLVDDATGVLCCWGGGSQIPVATLPEHLLMAEIRFDACVEATMRRRESTPDLREMAPMSIGIGPGYRPGVNCHVAVESQWGPRLGAVLRDGATAARDGGPWPLAGVTRDRFAVAPAAGTWRTQRQLGQKVEAGELLGRVGEVPIAAPIGGHLRGLSHDDVPVRAGARVAEVDPRPDPQVFGLGERPLAIAAGVGLALGLASQRGGGPA